MSGAAGTVNLFEIGIRNVKGITLNPVYTAQNGQFKNSGLWIFEIHVIIAVHSKHMKSPFWLPGESVYRLWGAPGLAVLGPAWPRLAVISRRLANPLACIFINLQTRRSWYLLLLDKRVVSVILPAQLQRAVDVLNSKTR